MEFKIKADIWKESVKNINNFDILCSQVIKGWDLHIYTKDFENLIYLCKNNLELICVGYRFVNKFVNINLENLTFIDCFLNEETTKVEIHSLIYNYINKDEIKEFFGVEKDLDVLEKLLEKKENLVEETEIWENLKKMKSLSNEWAMESEKLLIENELYNDRFDNEKVNKHLKSCSEFPVNIEMKSKLEHIVKINKWISESKELLNYNSEELMNCIEKIESHQIDKIIEGLENVKKSENFIYHDFFCDYYENLKNILFTIIGEKKAKKPKKLHLEIQKKILQEGLSQNLGKNFEDTIEKLKENINLYEEWQNNYKKLNSFDKKKKAKKAIKHYPKEMLSEDKKDEDIQMDIEDFDKPIKKKSSGEIKKEMEEEDLNEKQKNPKIDKRHYEQKIKKSLYYYYYKLPELIRLYYESLKIPVFIEESNKILGNLESIYYFLGKSKSVFTENKFNIEFLSNFIKQGKLFNCFLPEISYMKKLEKWGSSWIILVKNLLNTIPQVKLYYKKKEILENEEKNVSFPYNFLSGKFKVSFDIAKMEFLIEKEKTEEKDEKNIDIDENNNEFKKELDKLESQKRENEIDSEEDEGPYRLSDFEESQKCETEKESMSAKEKKYISKRKRNISKLFRDSEMTVYNPVHSFEVEESKGNKKTKGNKNTFRKKIAPEPTNKKLKISSKEYFKRFNLLKEENVDEKYCICRKGYDGLALMIQCDNCQEWFHGDCLLLKPSSIRSVNVFNCYACVKRFNLKYTWDENDFSWNVFKRITFEETINLQKEGDLLPIEIKEREDLKILIEKFIYWQKRAEKELETGTQFELLDKSLTCKDLEKSQKERDKTIFILYLESLYFPIECEDAEKLMQILQKRDYIRNCLKFFKKKESLKNINKFLAKNYTFLNSENKNFDKEIFSLYFKLKQLHEDSSQMSKAFEKLIESKASYFEFSSLIQKCENSNLCLEDIENYKENLESLSQWEKKISEALSTRRYDLEKLTELKDEYKKYFCSSPLYINLCKVIDDSYEWLHKAWKKMYDKGNNDVDLEELIKEGEKIPCTLPYFGFLKTMVTEEKKSNENNSHKSNDNNKNS